MIQLIGCPAIGGTHGKEARGMSRLHVVGAVADHDALLRVQFVPHFAQHHRLGLLGTTGDADQYEQVVDSGAGQDHLGIPCRCVAADAQPPSIRDESTQHVHCALVQPALLLNEPLLESIELLERLIDWLTQVELFNPGAPLDATLADETAKELLVRGWECVMRCELLNGREEGRFGPIERSIHVKHDQFHC